MAHAGTLTKADLINHLVAELHIAKKDACLLVNTFLGSMVSELRAGGGVELRGFGSFKLRSRAGRVGRNPKTGEPVNLPPKRVVYFKLGKDLRNRLIEPIKATGQPATGDAGADAHPTRVAAEWLAQQNIQGDLGSIPGADKN